MKFALPVIVLLMVLSLVSCLKEKIGRALPEPVTPKPSKVEENEALDAVVYKAIVPGLPVAPKTRLGGLYKETSIRTLIVRKRSHFELAKDKYVTLFFGISVVGIFGLLLGAVMAYFKAPTWKDVMGISAVVSVFGATGALYIDFISWVIAGAAVTAFIYFVLVMYRKHRDEKFKEHVVSSFQQSKHLPWEEGGKQIVQELNLPSWVDEHVQVYKSKLENNNAN